MSKDSIQNKVLNYKNDPSQTNLDLAVSSFYEELVNRTIKKFMSKKINNSFIDKDMAEELSYDLIHDNYEILLKNYEAEKGASFLTYADRYLDFRALDKVAQIYEKINKFSELSDEGENILEIQDPSPIKTSGNDTLHFTYKETQEDDGNISSDALKIKKVQAILMVKMTIRESLVFLKVKFGQKNKEIAEELGVSPAAISRLDKNSKIKFKAYFDEQTKEKIRGVLSKN